MGGNYEGTVFQLNIKTLFFLVSGTDCLERWRTLLNCKVFFLIKKTESR